MKIYLLKLKKKKNNLQLGSEDTWPLLITDRIWTEIKVSLTVDNYNTNINVNPRFRLTYLDAWMYKRRWLLLNKGKWKAKVIVAQSCPALCDPVDCSPPGSAVHGALQARILERAVIPFSRGSTPPRDWTRVPHTAGRLFTIWATREASKQKETEPNF